MNEPVTAPPQPPVLKPPRKPVIAEEPARHSLLHHLGLPFFFRHMPAKIARGATFWGAFIITTIVVIMNVLWMPYDEELWIFAFRRAMFGHVRTYTSATQGAEYIFYQAYVGAIILSCCIAPLYAALSFTGERVSGTMEFLRLAPFSTRGIIIGKMLAPPISLHMISISYLAVGAVFGFLGGLDAVDILTAFLCIVLCSITFSALGIFLGCMTVGLRGFLAVIGLLVIGFFSSLLPVFALEERCMGYIAYLSPWGMMDAQFWHSMSRWRRVNLTQDFWGSEAAVPLFMLVAHLTVSGLLVQAAGRKLDSPEKTALSRWGWLIAFGLLLFTAYGATQNAVPAQFMRAGFPHGYEMAGAMMLVAGGFLSALVVLDHPHDRQTMLSHECERLAGREAASHGHWRRLSHAVLVALMAGLISASGFAFMHVAVPSNMLARGWFAMVVAIWVIIALVLSLILEASFIRFSSRVARYCSAVAGAALLLVCIVVPIGHFGSVNQRCSMTRYALLNQLQEEKARANNSGNLSYNNWYGHYLRNPGNAVFIEGLNTIEDVQKVIYNRRDDSFEVFYKYSPKAVIIYPAIFFAYVAVVLVWRRRAYRKVFEEAKRAVTTA